jgi:hypothetical protein
MNLRFYYDEKKAVCKCNDSSLLFKDIESRLEIESAIKFTIKSWTHPYSKLSE